MAYSHLIVHAKSTKLEDYVEKMSEMTKDLISVCEGCKKEFRISKLIMRVSMRDPDFCEECQASSVSSSFASEFGASVESKDVPSTMETNRMT